MRTTGEKIAGIFGATYVAIGLLGFVATSGIGFADTEGNNLLGIFEINPLHNLVHLGIGVALLLAFAGGARAVTTVAGLIGVVYIAVGVVGFFVESTDANILALNVSDHLLHLASGAFLLLAASLARQPREATV
ncbi:MAG TPA: DUF4383 domain-containing protein [Actinomycetota bacterium]|nr:DUF4383 domain-containing protein [Actinomycetota bacterium]